MENTPQTDELNKKTEPAVPETEQGEPVEEKKQDESQKLQGEVAELKDRYLRLYSEFENFRRRTTREKGEMILSANEQLIKSLLPVADDFERAEKALRESGEKSSEGFSLIRSKLTKVLDQYGVKAMDVQKGADFNADLHEAITQIPAGDDALKGKVVEVIEKGYFLNDKLIRYAKVVVGN